MKIKTGNAILIALFSWLSYEVPLSIFKTSKDYQILIFADLSIDFWMSFSMILFLFLACIFLVTGIEPNKQYKIKKRETKKIPQYNNYTDVEKSGLNSEIDENDNIKEIEGVDFMSCGCHDEIKQTDVEKLKKTYKKYDIKDIHDFTDLINDREDTDNEIKRKRPFSEKDY